MNKLLKKLDSMKARREHLISLCKQNVDQPIDLQNEKLEEALRIALEALNDIALPEDNSNITSDEEYAQACLKEIEAIFEDNKGTKEQE